MPKGSLHPILQTLCDRGYLRLSAGSRRYRAVAALFAAGCTWPDLIDASESARSADGTEQNVVLECELATGVDEDV